MSLSRCRRGRNHHWVIAAIADHERGVYFGVCKFCKARRDWPVEPDLRSTSNRKTGWGDGALGILAKRHAS